MIVKSVTSTELGYLSGISSSIQTQFINKATSTQGAIEETDKLPWDRIEGDLPHPDEFLFNLSNMLKDAFEKEKSILSLIKKGIEDSVCLMNVYQYFQSVKEELKTRDIIIPDLDNWVDELSILQFRIDAVRIKGVGFR